MSESDAMWAANDEGADAYDRGDFGHAIAAFARATSLLTSDEDPVAELIYENLGMALYDAGRYPAAVRAFLRTLDGRYPGSELSLRLLIPALVASGLVEAARRRLDEYNAAFGAHPHGVDENALAALAREQRRRRIRHLPG